MTRLLIGGSLSPNFRRVGLWEGAQNADTLIDDGSVWICVKLDTKLVIC